MLRIRIVIRELGATKPDYSLLFDVPELPRVGDYISIHRPDLPEPYSEDLIIRHVWWRLNHGEMRGVVTDGNEIVGAVKEINVECDPATGPYSSDRWRDSVSLAEGKMGIKAEVFQIQRFSVRERDLPK